MPIITFSMQSYDFIMLKDFTVCALFGEAGISTNTKSDRLWGIMCLIEILPFKTFFVEKKNFKGKLR